MTAGATLARRRGRRPPEPYIIEHEHERFDFGCASCRVVLAGVRGRDAAQAWAETHRCEESYADQRRPFP